MHVLPSMGVRPGPLWRKQLLGETAFVVSAMEEELFEDFDTAIVLWMEQWAPPWTCIAIPAAMPADREAGTDNCLRCARETTSDLAWESFPLRLAMPPCETRKQARVALPPCRVVE